MKIECHASIGGISVREDARKLESGVHVVVGTPGRVFDMIANRRAFRTGSLKMFVLDEADEMLSRGFKDQIYDIFRLLPSTTQVCISCSLIIARLCSSLLPCPLMFLKYPRSSCVTLSESWSRKMSLPSKVSSSSMSVSTRKSGSLRPCAISTRPSPSLRPSSSATPVVRSIGWLRSFCLVISLSLPWYDMFCLIIYSTEI
jgi:hypothetical protein